MPAEAFGPSPFEARPAAEHLRVTEVKISKPGKAEKWAARSERLAAALRENLKRRKAQARRRAAAPTPADDTAEADSAQSAKVPDFRRNRGNE